MLSRTLFRIWTPQLRVGEFLSAIRIFGFLFASIGAAFGVHFLASHLARRSLDDHFGWVCLLPIFSSSIGFLWLLGFNRWSYLRAMRGKELRKHRLQRLLSNSRADGRFRHREIELYCYDKNPRKKDLESFVRSILKGAILIVNGPRHNDVPWPRPMMVSFEPVSLEHDTEELGSLIEANLGEQFEIAEIEEEESQESRSTSQVLSEGWSVLFFFLKNVLPPVFFFVWLFWRKDLWFIGLFAAIMIWSFIRQSGVIAGREWWIVPGGLVYRQHRSWKERIEIRTFSRKSTPLYLDFRTLKGMVLEEGNPKEFTITRWTGWLLIAAWTSGLASPGDEKMHSFFSSLKDE